MTHVNEHMISFKTCKRTHVSVWNITHVTNFYSVQSAQPIVSVTTDTIGTTGTVVQFLLLKIINITLELTYTILHQYIDYYIIS